MKEGLAEAVGVSFQGVSPEMAPSFRSVDEKEVKTKLSMNSDGHVLMAEHDIRAWQSLLLAYVLLDIDFDSPSMEFKPETPDEQAEIHVHNFSLTRAPRPRNGGEFEIYGRAFLALDEGRPLIEIMALYREGAKALYAGRAIDAYNSFYLFFESQYCRHTSTKQATDELMKSSEFMGALDSVVAETIDDKDYQNLRLKSFEKWKTEPHLLIKEIVELRGHLRHHSLNSPHRWDPDKQEHFDREAIFLSLVANEIAFPKTTRKLWGPTLLARYTQLAQEMHMDIEIHVKMTIKENERIRDVAINMKVPQRTPNTQLAKFVLTKALETLDEKSPGAELYAIRASVKSKGTELFRYDVGPSLTR